jgi:hypothetical protein
MGKVKKNVGKRQGELTLRKSTNEKKTQYPAQDNEILWGK